MHFGWWIVIFTCWIRSEPDHILAEKKKRGHHMKATYSIRFFFFFSSKRAVAYQAEKKSGANLNSQSVKDC